jgi:hypothetical protein
MALNPALAQDDDYMLICVAPDVCFTPSKPYAPTPYPIVHKLGQSKGVSKNVYFRDKKAYRHKVSYVDKVQGDEPDMGKGLISHNIRYWARRAGWAPGAWRHRLKPLLH